MLVGEACLPWECVVKAVDVAECDGGLLPLLFLKASWALRNGLGYTTNPMGYSSTSDVHPK